MRRIFLVAVAIVSLLTASEVSADILFESGTLGPTGVPYSALVNGTVPSTSVDSAVFPGVRFHFDQRAATTRVGGHFVGPIGRTFFAAIVELADESDFPNSVDLSSSDVLGHTLLSFPTTSAEVFGDLRLSLDPGWYALAFGSGLFGATASGAAVRNGIDIGEPSYIAYEINGTDWFDLNKFGTSFDNHRFVVDGYFVPEPSSIMIAVVFLLSMRCCCRSLRK